MVVEGDDRWTGRTFLRGGGEVLEQVCVTQVHPVEDPDHDQHRPVLRSESFDPVDDVHELLSRPGP
jgi:hypothetical protein